MIWIFINRIGSPINVVIFVSMITEWSRLKFVSLAQTKLPNLCCCFMSVLQRLISFYILVGSITERLALWKSTCAVIVCLALLHFQLNLLSCYTVRLYCANNFWSVINIIFHLLLLALLLTFHLKSNFIYYNLND